MSSISSAVKRTANVAWAGVYFPVVGAYPVEVDGVEYQQVVRIVAGEVDDEDAGTLEATDVFSWEAGDDSGTHESGEWYDSLEEAIAAARAHVEGQEDGSLADHCG